MATVREAANNDESESIVARQAYYPALKRIASPYTNDGTDIDFATFEYVEDLIRATPKMVRDAIRLACKSKGVKTEDGV